MPCAAGKALIDALQAGKCSAVHVISLQTHGRPGLRDRLPQKVVVWREDACSATASGMSLMRMPGVSRLDLHLRMNGDVVLGDEDALDPENSASVMSSNSGTAVHPVSGAAAAVLTAMQYHPAGDIPYSRAADGDVLCFLHLNLGENMRPLLFDTGAVLPPHVVADEPKMNCTPGGSIVNWHIDPLVAALLQIFDATSPLGTVVKVLVTAPPTRKNLEAASNLVYQPGAPPAGFFARVLSELQEVEVVGLQGGDVVFLPPGTFHTVLTIEHCYLVGPLLVSGAPDDVLALRELWKLWDELDSVAARAEHKAELAFWEPRLVKAVNGFGATNIKKRQRGAGAHSQ